MTRDEAVAAPHPLAEESRILAEYDRREREVDPSLYAPWNTTEMFYRERRRRVAAWLLHRAGLFPDAEGQCLEVGYGRIGWLADLVGWGVPCRCLHGIELDSRRAAVAQSLLPGANLLVGDAATMPWGTGTFRLIIASTVFSSILEESMRCRLADEMARVLAPGGAILCYDFVVNNPRNSAVRRVTRADLAALFPRHRRQHATLTLAPPIARRVVPISWPLATLLEALPLLRTHMLTLITCP
jgi:SAM-dependent methyltransferase